MTSEWNPETLFDVFESESARRILALVSVEPMDARSLAQACDIARPTVYRRLDVLQDFDLLEERNRVDADGNHYSTYETRLESVRFELEDGGFTIDVTYRHDVVD